MTHPTPAGTPVSRPGVMRDHTVHERAATPLELLFDLCFVVAVAILAAELDHGIVDGHPWEAAATYALLFVPVWWAWMSYTWYATAFSHDDPVTRVLTLLQMAGVLAVAAAIPAAVDGDVLPFALCYSAMRLPLILLWLRSARADEAHRSFATTYAVGSAIAQVLWIVGALLPGPGRAVVFLLALVVDLGTPTQAVRRSPGPVFHPGHIAERYGLFTIIVLGETVLAVSVGFRDVLDGGDGIAEALVIVGAALAVSFGLWWIYFDALGRDGLTRNRTAAFIWGYGHYVLFAALAAFGAGITAQLHLSHKESDYDLMAAAVVAVPVAIALAAVAWLQQVANGRSVGTARIAGAALLAALCVPLGLAASMAAVDVVLAVIVSALVLREVTATRDEPADV